MLNIYHISLLHFILFYQCLKGGKIRNLKKNLNNKSHFSFQCLDEEKKIAKSHTFLKILEKQYAKENYHSIDKLLVRSLKLQC